MVLKERSKPPLTPHRRIMLSLLSGFLFMIILGAIIYSVPARKIASLPTPTPQSIKTTVIAYQGKAGIDALALLKEHATVELDRSGMVSSINGRSADGAKREFWSFYINGKVAEVGPAAYITKDQDQLKWKIDTY